MGIFYARIGCQATENQGFRTACRVLNIGEFIEELEIQQQDPQMLALPFDDRFQLLTDGVYQRKYNDKVRRLIKNAKFRLPKADIHDILYIDCILSIGNPQKGVRTKSWTK